MHYSLGCSYGCSIMTPALNSFNSAVYQVTSVQDDKAPQLTLESAFGRVQRKEDGHSCHTPLKRQCIATLTSILTPENTTTSNTIVQLKVVSSTPCYPAIRRIIPQPP